jgi:hypothetical protein
VIDGGPTGTEEKERSNERKMTFHDKYFSVKIQYGGDFSKTMMQM